MSDKPKHSMFALGEKKDGSGFVLIIGVTESGMKVLNDKLTLTVAPPQVLITDIVIFHELTLDDMRSMFEATGLPINRGDFDKLKE